MSNNKPMPIPTEISAPFWEGLKAERLLIQQCDDCNHWVFYPRRHCPACFAHALTWREVNGAATLYSYTVTRIATLPDFADEMPQILAVIELEQGVRINSNLVGLDETEVKIGMPLQPVFAEVDAKGTRLLRFTGLDKDPVALQAVRREPEPVVSEKSALRQIALSDTAALQALVSDTFSPWSNQVVVDQALIDAFAQLSGDDYWIHTDPERARKQSPFGGTIAHGFLSLSLIPKLIEDILIMPEGLKMAVNYGLDSVRFIQPVKVNSKVRLNVTLTDVTEKKPGQWLFKATSTLEIEGQEKPAYIAESLSLCFV